MAILQDTPNKLKLLWLPMWENSKMTETIITKNTPKPKKEKTNHKTQNEKNPKPRISKGENIM